MTATPAIILHRRSSKRPHRAGDGRDAQRVERVAFSDADALPTSRPVHPRRPNSRRFRNPNSVHIQPILTLAALLPIVHLVTPDTHCWNRIRLIQADITADPVDAIVNAANTSLLGGGGVDGAIHRAAGPQLLAECRSLGGCDTGSAKITNAYNLPAKFVIHAVGPVYQDGRHDEPQHLAGCYRSAMNLAADAGCKSIAFPAISCGVYGYPMADAARIALKTVAEELAACSAIQEARFVLFGKPAYKAFEAVLHDLSGSA